MTQIDIDGNAVPKKPDGTEVWLAYDEAFRDRYGFPPLRSAKTNSQALKLAKELGTQLAADMVRYFLTRNDAFYVHTAHPLGACLVAAQKLVVEMRNGRVITMTTARRMELHDETDRAIRSYLNVQEANGNPTKTISS